MDKFTCLKEFLFAKKYYIMGVGFLLLIILIVILCSSFASDKGDINYVNDDNDNILLSDNDISEEDETVVCFFSVDIKGEVKNPGVYKVECDKRVEDVINLAGGLTANGDTTVLNLGKKIKDEMVIIVYSKSEVKNFISTKNQEEQKVDDCLNKNEIKNDACIKSDELLDTSTSDSGDDDIIGDTPVNLMVSINTASKEELMSLSGIGESKAQSIINYRNQYGSFKKLEEIKNVKGIGDSVFEKIKDNITL